MGFANSKFEIALRTLAPELQESEDDAIRKKLIDLFKQGEICIYGEFDNVLFIEWLERQGQNYTKKDKWHNIEDGELPKKADYHYIIIDKKDYCYKIAYYSGISWYVNCFLVEAKAWCELPRYGINKKN